MKRAIIILLFFAAAVAVSAENMKKAKFAYDVDFEFNFDNREFYRSAFSESMTIFGARLTPSVGVSLHESDGTEHRIMFGVDAMKDFGDSPASLQNVFGEALLYYRLEKQVRRTGMEIYAGIFPRRAMESTWSQAFFSDSLRFYDSNIEGLLLKFRRKQACFEVGCDWMGKYGQTRRERFMIFSSGGGRVLPFLKLGYDGYMLHYANSEVAKGLVDNILLNPYALFELVPFGLITLNLRVGWLQAVQRDREHVGRFVTPYGGEFDQYLTFWRAGINNRMFYGMDMMPYYNSVDNAGEKYGPNLYFGDPFYRIHDNGRTGAGFYDRLEVYYEPFMNSWLDMRISAVFHFHSSRYSGCQQMVSLRLNIDELINRKR